MISREKFAKEMLLRENIRKAIKIVNDKKLKERKQDVIERIKLRSIIRSVILEAASDPEEDPHPSTGINVLRDLIKNSNFLKTIRTGYKSLTTDKEQRLSYRAHIVNAIEKSLAPIRATDSVDLDDGEINEDVDIEIEDEDKFIEGEPERISPDDEEEDDIDPDVKAREDFSSGVEGFDDDTTGRDRAYSDFNDIEQTIIDHFGMLGNPDDQEKFFDYLIANTKLYFDRYESEISGNIEEPTNQEYEDASEESEEVPETPPEEDMNLDTQL